MPAPALTFTVLHTNDLHSNLIGVGPASEYSPQTLNDDGTIGGIERIASLIAERRKARETAGTVESASSMEIKEWQALTEYLKTLPKKNDEGISVLAMDERATENRTINLRE